MIVNLDRKLKIPFYRQITNQLKRKILSGQLADGAILPSERGLAEQLGVHRNTVIRAYAGLKDLDLIDSRPGMGYVVTCPREDVPEPARPRPVNWEQMIKDEYLDMKEMYDDIFVRFSEGSGISLSAGVPPFVYPEEEIGDEIAAILKESETLPAYMSPYQGDPFLRKEILSYLRTKGIKAGPSQIQILSETNQALDFIITAMLNPGDCVIIEEPVSPDVYRVIQLAGCRFVTVPVDPDGMICTELEGLIQREKPRFIYVNSSYHDPTGAILSMERRQELLALSNKYRIPIVEEDAASELHYEDGAIPTLKSMDTCGNVIYIYSFSLTFIPGISLAIVVADEKLIHSLRYLVSIRIIGINWINQKLLAKYLQNGLYYERVEEIISHCRVNRDILCSELDVLSDIGLEYRKPRGGVYIWCRLPEGLSGQDVAAEASRNGVSIMPGEVFFPDRNDGSEYIRLNYSYESGEWLLEGAKRLVGIIRKMYRLCK